MGIINICARLFISETKLVLAVHHCCCDGINKLHDIWLQDTPGANCGCGGDACGEILCSNGGWANTIKANGLGNVLISAEGGIKLCELPHKCGAR